MPTAALAALYDAATIIALRLLALVSSSASLYEERIRQHAKSILVAKEFVANIPGPTANRGSIMVGFPFQIMCIWSPVTTNGIPSHLFAKPGELFSDLAAYILENQSPRQPSRDGCLEDSRFSDTQAEFWP
jgi:hypothetical protein